MTTARRTSARARLAAMVVLLVSLPGSVSAQATCAPPVHAIPACIGEPDAASLSRARTLFQEGVAHIEGGRWADALSVFHASYQSSCVPAALLNMAIALRGLGRWVETREAVRVVLERHADLPSELEPMAQDILRESTARVAILSLVDLPVAPQPTIRVDGQACGDDEARPLRLAVDPGPRSLDVTAPGRLPFHWERRLAPAARERVRIELPELTDDTAVGWGIGLGVAAAIAIGIAIGLAVHFGSQGPSFDDSVEI